MPRLWKALFTRLAAAAAWSVAVLAVPAPVLAEPVWLTLDADAYRLLREQQLEHQALERHAVKVSAGRLGEREDTLMIVRADDEQLHRLSLAAHDALHRCGGFVAHASLAQARQHLAALQRHAGGRLAPAASATPSYAIDDQAQVSALLPQLKESEILAGIEKMQSYANRYYRNKVGARASNELAAAWQALAAGRTDASVGQVSHSGFAQKSVTLTLRGSTAPEEIVVIGAHLDSISPQAILRPTGKAPGADDDASGIATMQEVMRVLLQSGWRPSRTVQFIGYAGEEAGLLGSKDIAARYAAEGRQVVGVLQLDMTAYQGSTSDITLISDYTSTAQDDFLAALAGAYQPELRVTRDVCGYACSDHASWTANGYAASFPFEASFGEDNPVIHTPKDTTAQFGGSAAHALKFARLALAYAVELGSDAPAPLR